MGTHWDVLVDPPGAAGDPIPRTMRAYAKQGTPTTVLIDARGYLRTQVFGVHDELRLGAELQTLLLEATNSTRATTATTTPSPIATDPASAGCSEEDCVW